MMDFFDRQSEETKQLILKLAIVAVVLIALVLFITIVARRSRHSLSRLKKMRQQVEAHQIDTIRTSLFSRSDVSLWIKDYMKSGTECVLMTGQAAWEKDHAIQLPVAIGGSVFYLCIINARKQTVIRQRFIIADRVEPELDALVRKHAGAVWFTH